VGSPHQIMVSYLVTFFVGPPCLLCRQGVGTIWSLYERKRKKVSVVGARNKVFGMEECSTLGTSISLIGIRLG
jgi:hypothetical protein